VAAVDPAQYVANYELLRSQVIGARADLGGASAAGLPRGVGLALLLREGMPGWLKALEGVIRASGMLRTANAAEVPAAESPSAYGSAPEWLSSVPHRDLTALLVNLVLSTRCVEHPIPNEGYRSCQ
jgi:hypothetical protein